jgi:hypothetical protein
MAAGGIATGSETPVKACGSVDVERECGRGKRLGLGGLAGPAASPLGSQTSAAQIEKRLVGENQPGVLSKLKASVTA